MTPTPDQLIAWQREWTDAWDRNDPDAVAARFHEDCVLVDVGVPTPIRGPEEARQHAVNYMTTTPGQTMKEISIATNGNLVFQEWRSTGVHPGEGGGEIMGVRGGGKRFDVRGCTVTRFSDDGQRLEMWTYWDVIGYMRQLGVLPENASAAVGY